MFNNTVKVSEASEFCKPVSVEQRWAREGGYGLEAGHLSDSFHPPSTITQTFSVRTFRSRHQDRMTQLRALLETHL